MVALRALAIVAWFLVIILPHLLLTLAGRRDLVPPLFLAGLGWLAGLRVRAVGRPAPGHLLLIGNHISWLDILALASTARATFVAHGGLAGHSFLEWLCEQNDTVFVARERRGTVSEQVRQVEAALAIRRLVIFPEGTTGNGRELGPFKSSLLSAAEQAEERDAALTIQPVALDYDEAASIAWFGAEPGISNVLRILARVRRVRLTIRFLEPLDGAELADRKTMGRAAHAAITRALRL